MKAVTAVVITVAGLVLAGCASGALGQAAPQPANQVHGVASAYPATGSAQGLADSIARHVMAGGNSRMPAGPWLKFRDTEYNAFVSNPGAENSFTAFATAIRQIQVRPSSAAIVSTISAGAPVFPAASERIRWRAAGRPQLPQAPVKGQVLRLSAETFSFTPQGASLTYQQMRSMPTSAGAIYREILTHLGPYGGTHPPATIVATQFGFLLASAPLAKASRAAAWMALGSIPGLRLCGSGTDLTGRHGEWMCVTAQGHETELLVSPPANALLTVIDRVTQPSPLYPGVPAGSVVESDAFNAG